MALMKKEKDGRLILYELDIIFLYTDNVYNIVVV
jgi:hypothetical protein